MDGLSSMLVRPFDESNLPDLLALMICTEANDPCMLQAILSVNADQRRSWLGGVALDYFPHLVTCALESSSPNVLTLMEELVDASSAREAVTFVLEGLSSCSSARRQVEASRSLAKHLLSLLLKALLGMPNPKQRVRNAMVSIPSIARAADLLSSETDARSDSDLSLETFISILGELKDKVFTEIDDRKQLSVLSLHIASSFYWIISKDTDRDVSFFLRMLRHGYELKEIDHLEAWLMLYGDVKMTLKDMEDDSYLVASTSKADTALALFALLHSKPNSNHQGDKMPRVNLLEAGLSLSQSLIAEASDRESNALLVEAMDLISRTGDLASHSHLLEEGDRIISAKALDLSRILAINVVFGSDPALGKRAYSTLSSLLAGLSPPLCLKIIHSLAGWPRHDNLPPPPVVSLALSLLQHYIMKILTGRHVGGPEVFNISSTILGPVPEIVRSFIDSSSPVKSIEEGEGDVVFAAVNLLRSICLYFDCHKGSDDLRAVARMLFAEAKSFFQQATEFEANSDDEIEMVRQRLQLAVGL